MHHTHSGFLGAIWSLFFRKKCGTVRQGYTVDGQLFFRLPVLYIHQINYRALL